MIRSTVIGFTVPLALAATAGYAVQEFTLDEARTRIERLEARVASLETLTATGGTPEAVKTHLINGTVLLPSSQHFATDITPSYEYSNSCFGDAGFDDINAEASIRVLDEAGNIVGSDHLNEGVLIDAGSGLGCEFSWVVEVKDAEFYVVEIANREGPSFSRADLEEYDWSVALIIGD